MVSLRNFVANMVFAFARALHIFFGFGPSCRFVPTCSQYAREAINTFGIFQGSWLAFKRILKCRPGGKWGQDTVPVSLRRGGV